MQLANDRSPLDVQRQMEHRTLAMTNNYASLSVKQSKKSHDQNSTLRADKSKSEDGTVLVIGMSNALPPVSASIVHRE